MATDSKRKDNKNTPKEQWVPVGYEAIEVDE